MYDAGFSRAVPGTTSGSKQDERYLPRHVEMVDSSFGQTPLGSVASYQLREKPTYTANLKTENSPAQTGTHPAKTGANPSTTRVPSDGSPLKQVYFLLCLCQSLRDVKAKEGVSEWPIDLDLSQRIEARTRGQASNSEWQDLHTHTITASKFKLLSVVALLES